MIGQRGRCAAVAEGVRPVELHERYLLVGMTGAIIVTVFKMLN